MWKNTDNASRWTDKYRSTVEALDFYKKINGKNYIVRQILSVWK